MIGKRYPGVSVVYCLTPAERRIAQLIAIRRNSEKEAWQQAKLSRRHDDDLWEVGVSGEIAVGFFFGRHPDFTQYKHGDRGFDFEVGGMFIDVKTRTKPGDYMPDLILPPKSPPANDIHYVLAFVDDDFLERRNNNVHIVGWATRDMFTQVKLSDFETRHGVEYGKMIHFKKLLDRVVPPTNQAEMYMRFGSG